MISIIESYCVIAVTCDANPQIGMEYFRWLHFGDWSCFILLFEGATHTRYTYDSILRANFDHQRGAIEVEYQ